VLVPIWSSAAIRPKIIMMGELVPSWYPSSTLATAFVCYGLIMSSSITANGQKTESDERHPMTRQSPFSVPAPVKRLFDVFPLITLPQNELPLRSQQARKAKGHALFCWSTAEDAAGGAASFNPTCLKWQVRYQSIAFQVGIFNEMFECRHI